MLMAMWRILEVTVLNSYFNSFKCIREYEGKLSYISVLANNIRWQRGETSGIL